MSFFVYNGVFAKLLQSCMTIYALNIISKLKILCLEVPDNHRHPEIPEGSHGTKQYLWEIRDGTLSQNQILSSKYITR